MTNGGQSHGAELCAPGVCAICEDRWRGTSLADRIGRYLFQAARHERDRAFVQAFWNLHRGNVLRGCACWGSRVDPACALGQTARRLGVAA